jgi:quercetin dioxygenase-like cupin family protein
MKKGFGIERAVAEPSNPTTDPDEVDDIGLVTLSDSVLDDETLSLIGSAQRPVEIANNRLKDLRTRIMGCIEAEERAEQSGLLTVHADDGCWERIAPKIEKKVLQIDQQSGTEAYLLRVEAGAGAPPHRHQTDEICIMLDGEIRYGDFYLRAGDYHFAPKESVHSEAHSETGTLLFIRAGIESTVPV